VANRQSSHFVFGFPLSAEAWQRYDVRGLLPEIVPANPIQLHREIRALAESVRSRQSTGPAAEDRKSVV